MSGVDQAKKVLERNSWDAFDETPFVSSWIIRSDRHDPILMGVSAMEKGHHYGYVFVLKFLSEVGVGNTFLTSTMFPAGKYLFDKLVDTKAVEYVEQDGLVVYPHKFRVLNDPMQSLREFVERAERPGAFPLPKATQKPEP
jgi:hypothetical protein